MSNDTSAASPSAKHAARRRTLLILGAISIGWKVVVLTLGAAVPRWLLTDGIAELPAAHQAYGIASLATARALYDTPVERLGRIVRQVRVVSVDTVGSAEVDAAGPGEPASCAMGARVRAYTYFAIPYSEARTQCGRGVIEYRMFRLGTRAD